MWSSMIIFARVLTKSEFGDWGYLWGILMSLMMFVDGPWSAAVTKYVAEYREREKEKAGQVIALYFSFMVICSFLIIIPALLAPQIAKTLNHENLSKAFVFLFCSIIPLGFLSQIKGVINGVEEFKLNSVMLPLLAGIDFSVKLLGFFWKSFDGLVCALLVSAVIQLLIASVFCKYAMNKHGIFVVWKNCWHMSGKIVNYTIPSLFYILITCSGSILVPSFFLATPGGSETLAEYSVLLQLQAIVSFLPLMLATPMLATISNAFQRDFFTTWKSLKKLTYIIFAILFVSGCGIFVFGKYLLLMYGEQFVSLENMLRLFIVILIIQIICPFFNQIFGALDRVWLMSAVRLFWLIFYLGSSCFLVKYQLKGLIFANIIAALIWLFMCLLGLFYVYKKESGKKEC